MGGVIGVDVGGTFTDCVFVDDQGHARIDKAFTTPNRLVDGIIAAVSNVAEGLGREGPALLSEVSVMSVGTTSAVNRLVSRKGARVGLLTTRGHEDALIIGRISQKADGLSESERSDMLLWDKAEPIVPRPFIRGITERVDYKGSVVCALNEAEVVEAADALVAAGVEAIAICFLWSFRNAAHELRAREVVRERHPHVSVALSSEIAPVLGEYERAATTVINAYLGPGARLDLADLAHDLKGKGLAVPPLVMQSTGGLIDAESAALRPVYLLSSGPVGGVSGSVTLGSALDIHNIITTDMGGTSFDVGIVVKGFPELARQPIYDRYRVLVPAVGVVSIGAGGGSIARVAPTTMTLHVGPDSAGSRPGPVCYGFGGTLPTVTDADLVLGRISPERFFGGRKRLELQAARDAINVQIAEPLGLSEVEAAEGIVEIVDARMGDLIRKASIERGYDPRDFTLFAFGGGGPVHVGGYGRDVGVARAVIPAQASVFSAFGIAFSDIVRDYSLSEPLLVPFPPDRLESIFGRLERLAATDAPRGGLDGSALQRSVDMRFRYQAHVLRVPLADASYDEQALERLVQRFLAVYEEIYGKGTAYREVGIELVTFRLSVVTPLPRPGPGSRVPRARRGSQSSQPRELSRRKVRFSGAWVEAPVLQLEGLAGGMRLDGPAILEGATTTLVVHPDQKVTTDELGNVVLHFSQQTPPPPAVT